MNQAQIVQAQLVQWRCRGCGLARPVSDGRCRDCGSPRPLADRKRVRLLTAGLHNEGNGHVQNNVHNVAVHGNVTLGNYFTDSVDDDEKEERRERPSQRSHHSPLAAFLMFTSGVAMWMSVLAIGCVVAFFIAIIVKAFFLH